jgi:hypothetical protein
LGYRLRHNKERYKLLKGPDVDKYIKLKYYNGPAMSSERIISEYGKSYWMESSLEEEVWEDHD